MILEAAEIEFVVFCRSNIKNEIWILQDNPRKHLKYRISICAPTYQNFAQKFRICCYFWDHQIFYMEFKKKRKKEVILLFFIFSKIACLFSYTKRFCKTKIDCSRKIWNFRKLAGKWAFRRNFWAKFWWVGVHTGIQYFRGFLGLSWSIQISFFILLRQKTTNFIFAHFWNDSSKSLKS